MVTIFFRALLVFGWLWSLVMWISYQIIFTTILDHFFNLNVWLRGDLVLPLG